MATKSTRYVDDQGRVILPSHIRKALKLNPRSPVEVNLDDDGTIRIRPIDERCDLCGESVEGKYHTQVTIGPEKKRVCPSCIQTIANAIMKK